MRHGTTFTGRGGGELSYTLPGCWQCRTPPPFTADEQDMEQKRGLIHLGGRPSRTQQPGSHTEASSATQSHFLLT